VATFGSGVAASGHSRQARLEMDGVRPILHAVSISSDVSGPILSLGR
jgi:hypothetical protein